MKLRGWASVWLLSALALMGCDGLSTDLERDVAEVPLREIVELERKGCCPMVADGRTTDVLTAWLPREASDVAVTFKAARGGFVEAGGGTELIVRAMPTLEDAFRIRAQVTFISDTLAGSVRVSATVKGITAVLLIPFVPKP